MRHAELEIADGIARITLNRPEARNALSEEMRKDLDEHIATVRAEAGGAVKAVLLTGAGRSFCAGGDVKAMSDPARRGAEAGRRRMRTAQARLHSLWNLEVPVVAAVNGHAAGAGFAFALMADFIFAGPSTRFACSFGKIGLVPDWGCLHTLPRAVGLQRAKELIFTGRTIDADEAAALGIVYAKVADDAALVPAALAFAGRFRDASTHAIGLAKNVLNHSYDQDHRTLIEMEAFGQAISYSTPYHAEATRRFRDKEPALFDWERIEREAGA